VNRRFRLAAVERLRAGKLAAAARALGIARRELAEAMAHRDGLDHALRTGGAPQRGAPFELESAAARRARLRDELGRAGERVGVAQGRELAAMAAWNAARSDLRAVEGLHERHRLELAEADARAEQRIVDELAATRRHPDPGGEQT
jgi:flagellar protein FliJ